MNMIKCSIDVFGMCKSPNCCSRSLLKVSYNNYLPILHSISNAVVLAPETYDIESPLCLVGPNLNSY